MCNGVGLIRDVSTNDTLVRLYDVFLLVCRALLQVSMDLSWLQMYVFHVDM